MIKINFKGDRVDKDGNVKYYELGILFLSLFLCCFKLFVFNLLEGFFIGVGCEIVRW